MPSEGLTFALAAFGAGTGGMSAATQIYTAVRDRPRVDTDWGFTTRIGEKPTAYIDVTNVGQRATTVREVGFYAEPRELQIIRQGETEPWGRLTADIAFHSGPVFLEAGQSRRFEIVPDITEWGIHADFPLRAYAIDIQGRRIWGEAGPIVRMLVGDDPPLTEDDPPELRRLFDPPKPDLLPAQVEPRWKLWTRRELRKPSAWRRVG